MSCNRVKQYWLIILVVIVGFNTPIIALKIENSAKAVITVSSEVDKEITTVFIHGTLFPVMSWLVHRIECPMGLTPAKANENKYVLGRIGYTLDKADKERFPLESSYLFGWSGKLSFDARERAAEELYKLICHKKRIRLIAHSHGCNVVANLAKIVERLCDTTFSVEELVLLAPPVQRATKHYIRSPIFKKVRSFYSKGDIVQILDPQGLYKKNYKHKQKKKVPFFSERIYPASGNLIQTKVLIDDREPGHMDFILPKFMEHLPAVLKCLDTALETENITEHGVACCVNILKTKGKIKFSVEKTGKDSVDYHYALTA